MQCLKNGLSNSRSFRRTTSKILQMQSAVGMYRAVVVAADIVAGGAVSVVENAGSALDGAKKFICGIFGC